MRSRLGGVAAEFIMPGRGLVGYNYEQLRRWQSMTQNWLKWLKSSNRWISLSVLTISILVILSVIGYLLDFPDIRVCIKSADLNNCYFLGKTAWEWIRFVIVPAAVPLVLFVLGRSFQKQQQSQTLDEEKEEILQVYLDRLSSLLINENLLAIAAKIHFGHDISEKELTPIIEKINLNSITSSDKEKLDAGVNVIRARTLAILRRFNNDHKRKNSVTRFLMESEIIEKTKLNLSRADLSHINFSYADLSQITFAHADLHKTCFERANLSGANLWKTNLSYANLSYAVLSDAVFEDADLQNANLSNANPRFVKYTNRVLFNRAKLNQASFRSAQFNGADFSGADLIETSFQFACLNEANFCFADLRYANFQGAQLENTNFQGAILICTDFRDTENFIAEQLEYKKFPPYICNIALPSCITGIDPNRDCELLLKSLVKREICKSLKEAQSVINKAKSRQWEPS